MITTIEWLTPAGYYVAIGGITTDHERAIAPVRYRPAFVGVESIPNYGIVRTYGWKTHPK